MKVFSFLSVSMIEWFALITLGFTTFKLEIRGYRGQLIFTSFLLSLFSYIAIVVLQMKIYSTFLQPPIVFLFLWQMFRIPAFYAGVVTTSGYLTYTVLQSFIFFFFQKFGAIIEPETSITYLGQITTAALALLGSWIIYKKRMGYTFIPYGERLIIKFSGINLKLLLFTVLGYLMMLGFNYLLYSDFTLILLCILTLALLLLQFWVIRKEYSNDR
ncbi:hypothetical protein ACFFNY_19255 [Paenibacillus hodogayensis]|uniref:Uncharacterized protein n=1 Tax=Paenibacillus hodogayensis TaxID=279208 RepID=A0ABV5W0D4_9BACL